MDDAFARAPTPTPTPLLLSPLTTVMLVLPPGKRWGRFLWGREGREGTAEDGPWMCTSLLLTPPWPPRSTCSVKRARGLRDGAWPASQEAHHRLTKTHQPPPNFLCGCFCAKAEASSFFGFVFVVFLIFGNAQLRLYAGQNVPPPQPGKRNWYCCFSVFFFSFVCTQGFKKV